MLIDKNPILCKKGLIQESMPHHFRLVLRKKLEAPIFSWPGRENRRLRLSLLGRDINTKANLKTE